MKLTYRELVNKINDLTDEQKDMPIAIHITN